MDARQDCAILDTSFLFVAERHDERAGPVVLNKLLHLGASCGIHIECAFLELPDDLPATCLDGGLGDCPMARKDVLRRILTPDVLHAASIHRTALIPIDRPDAEALWNAYERAPAERKMSFWISLTTDRSAWMAENIRSSDCASGVMVAGAKHVFGNAGTIPAVLTRMGLLVGTASARCTAEDWDGEHQWKIANEDGAWEILVPCKPSPARDE